MVHGVTYKEDNFDDNTEQLKGICILIKQQAVHGGGGGRSAAHYFNYLDD